ncbi:MAG: CopD family protein [Pseudomonadota bacterium]
MALFKLLHILAVVVWVGGMFFAYMVLRPSAAGVLKQPERLRLWDSVFGRFFHWVWLAILLLFASGLYMVYQAGGIGRVPSYVHLMLLLGIVMLLLFVYIFFFCYVRFNLLVDEKNWTPAGALLATMRKLIAVNLVIGLLTIAIAVVGRA